MKTPPSSPKPTPQPSLEVAPILPKTTPLLPHSFSYRQKIGASLFLLFMVILIYYWLSSKSTTGQYVSESLKRGDLAVMISASGTLQPLQTVEVGSELSGTLQTILVDENDNVKKGQTLATLEPSKLLDAETKSKALVATAEAQVLKAQATLKEATSTFARQQKVFELSGGKLPSPSELEAAEAAVLRAKADVAISVASVSQAQANLKSDQTNLKKAVIKSPIDGVVLTKKVEVGQTVAASLSSPTLFTISEDLRKMELNINVDEADVSEVKIGQTVNFNVSAYINRTFPATITRVGIGSTLTDNVVTYKTVLSVNNEELLLRPGMTATAKITTAERKGVLLVPNNALRYTPPANAEAASQNSFLSKLTFKPPGAYTKKKVSETIRQGSVRTIWVLKEGVPTPMTVKVGITNGRFAEVTGEGLEEGLMVITEYKSKK